MDWYRFRNRTLKCLYPLDILHVGGLITKYYGFAPRKIALVNEGGNFYGAIPLSDFRYVSNQFLHLVKKNPGLIEQYLIEFDKRKKSYLELYQAINNPDIKQQSNEFLLLLLQEYNRQYVDSAALTWLAVAIFPIAMEKRAYEILAKKNLNLNQKVEYLSILSTPVYRSFMLEEEEALLQLALTIKSDSRLLRDFKDQHPIDLNNLATASPLIYEQLIKHTTNYKWVPFDYTGPAWSIEDIANKLSLLLRENLENKKARMQNHFTEIELKQSVLSDRLELTEEERSFFKVFRDLSIMQDIRKEVFTRAHHEISILLSEIGARIGLGLQSIRYLTADELSEALVQANAPCKLLEERKQLWAAICNENACKVYTGKRAHKIADITNDLSEVKEQKLKGSPASPGKVEGEVRVITNESDLEDMKQGEILVAKMTTPTFVIAMTKAGAIVTDEGGITSHAAIISRELGIPCIVGTRVATKVLESGDFITVDAYSGIVKKGVRKASSFRAPVKELKLEKLSGKYDKEILKDRKGVALVLPLREIKYSDVPFVGSKVAALGRIIRTLPVPDGFCVSSDGFRLFLENAGIKTNIEQVLSDVHLGDYDGLSKKSRSIQSLILEASLPGILEDAIIREYERLNCPVAVRSSSTLEDTFDRSGAGQHDTYLNIRNSRAVLEAVKRCWASLYSPRAISYYSLKGFEYELASMSVLVQRMINAVKAGVIFTVNPVSNNRQEMLVEAVFGLGELLVSGKGFPDSYRIDRRTCSIIEKKTAQKEVALYSTHDGGLKYKRLNRTKRTTQVLTGKELKLLCNYALELENLFGFPQDIEWAVSEGIYIIQSRPITTLTQENSVN